MSGDLMDLVIMLKTAELVATEERDPDDDEYEAWPFVLADQYRVGITRASAELIDSFLAAELAHRRAFGLSGDPRKLNVVRHWEKPTTLPSRPNNPSSAYTPLQNNQAPNFLTVQTLRCIYFGNVPELETKLREDG